MRQPEPTPGGARQDRARAAAETIWQLWATGERIAQLPETSRPTTLDEGWAAQRALDGLAGPLIGWKIAGSSAAGQQHIGVDAPIIGPLYEGTVLPSGVALPALSMGSTEPEFGFLMGADLPPEKGPYTRDQVLQAVSRLHPTIEVPDSRFTDYSTVGGPQLLADACCAAFVVVGDPFAEWEPDELPSHGVSVLCNGAEVSHGTGANALDDPCEALRWLANELASHGLGLRAGDLVITGACAPPNRVEPGDVITAEFQRASPVTVTLT